jgi:CDP-4-dehydro-6-deoxyglucose reductase, E3
MMCSSLRIAQCSVGAVPQQSTRSGGRRYGERLHSSARIGENAVLPRWLKQRVAHTVTLHGSGKRFSVQADETVLEAARRQGLALPYSCLGGLCGSCKATVISGSCHYPRQPPEALSGDERDHQQALLCQAVPLSDLTVIAREVASVADFPKRTLALKVVEMSLLAPDVMRLMLKAPRGERLRYLAGQYLDVLLPGGKRRAFSIANAPEDAELIELHIRNVAGGGFTHHVFAEMAVGEVLRVEGPLGTFVPREDSERRMLMVAGGTGFAPIKAIVEHFLHLGTARPIAVYWGVRAEADLYLPDLSARWLARHAELRFTEVLSEAPPEQRNRHRIGMVHEIVLADIPDLSGHDVYMSGPPPMIAAARRAFAHAGLSEERLYYDSFEYAPDVLAAILRGRAGIDHA